MSDSDEGIDERTISLDPFSARLAFANKRGMVLTTIGDRPGMKPVEPIDTKADKFIEIDELEKLASFHGLYRAPVELSEDAYPEEIQEALGDVEAQFILRNLSRSVRDADPEEPLQTEIVDSGRTNIATALVETRTARLERVELLDEMTAQIVGKHRNFMKELYDETAWEERFCRELKETITGPLWKYDPDAVADDEADKTESNDT